MKKSSLLKKYKKALRENANATDEAKRHIRQNYVTKLFFRIFLSSLILLMCVIYDSVLAKNNKTIKEYLINTNINFSKPTLFLNSMLGNYLNIDEEQEVSGVKDFSLIDYKNNTNLMIGTTFNGVKVICGGIVTKIVNIDNNLYVTVLGSDGYTYIYGGLESTDFELYSYVDTNEILGLANNVNNNYSFNLQIYKDGEYYNYQEYQNRL